MDNNTLIAVVLVTYALYLGWCRWLERRCDDE